MASRMDHWLQDDFSVFRRVDSDTWESEPFDPVGTIKGFLQPTGGGMSYQSGKEATISSARLYAVVGSDVKAGDRVVDENSITWVVTFAQVQGISGIHDHMELDLEALL